MRKRRIMHIDADEEYSASLGSALEERNYEFRHAGSGEKGLIEAGKRLPDLIVIDVKLPDRDGYSIVRDIKECAELGNVPAVILSDIDRHGGKGFAAAIAGFHKADAYVHKELGIREVCTALEKLLKKQEAIESFDGKQRIVAADADAEFAERLKEALEEAGFDPFLAENGVEALKLCRAFKPSLVLLEVMLEGMDGYSVCREIKTRPESRDMAVILVSAFHKELKYPETAERIAEAHQADEYVKKPVKEDEVMEIIRKYM